MVHISGVYWDSKFSLSGDRDGEYVLIDVASKFFEFVFGSNEINAVSPFFRFCRWNAVWKAIITTLTGYLVVR